MTVAAVLCDLDGVVRLWDPELTSQLEAIYALEPGAILAAAFEPGLMARAVTGRCTDAEWRVGLAELLASRSGDVEGAREAVARWSAPVGQVDHELLGLLARVRESRVPVVLVTNGTTRLDDDLAALGLHGSFDAVVNSAVVGAAKPGEAIFHAAAAAAEVDAGACLFIDDTAGHVEAARALGMTAIHYTGIESARETLESLGRQGAA